MKSFYGMIYFALGVIITFLLLEVRDRCFIKNNAKILQYEIIRKLTRQAARWTTAGKQDKNPLIAVLHANYGAGYLWALKDIANTEDIKDASGIDMLKFENEITKIQDRTNLNLIKICPKFSPDNSYLSKIGGEGA